jgi:hypothetical protein
MQSEAGDNSVAMPSVLRRVSWILLYAIGTFIVLTTMVAMIFPDCAADHPLSPEQCYIIESVTGGLFLVVLLSIITVGLRGGLPGARKFGATNSSADSYPLSAKSVNLDCSFR